jgi:hypothetical protein
MADFESSLPVRTLDDIELQVKTKTGTDLSVTAVDLDIRDLLYTQDSVQIWANTVKDGSGTWYVPLVDANGRLQVDVITGGGGGYQYQDGDAEASVYGNALLGGDGSNLQLVLVNAAGRLQVDVVAALPAGANSIGTVGLDAGSNIVGKVYITDGVEDAGVDASNNLQVNINAVGVTAIPISKDSNANSETNPIYVKTVDAQIGGEIHDYDVATAIAKGATSNHDYVVTSGTTLLLKRVDFSGSGALKAEVQVGPSGSPVTKAVGFTSSAKLMDNIEFNPPIEITAGDIVRIIRTNRDNQAQDLYSTIQGTEVS